MSVRILSFKAAQLLWILLGAAALLLLTLFFLFRGGSQDGKEAQQYIPGVYTTSMMVGNQAVTLEMTCSKDAILSLTYDVPPEVREVYPLVETCCASATSQLQAGTPVSALTFESACSDTAHYIMQAIDKLLKMSKG